MQNILPTPMAIQAIFYDKTLKVHTNPNFKTYKNKQARQYLFINPSI